MKTFAQFIEACRITDTPRGDFLGDAKTLISCGKMPGIKAWADLYSFMRNRSACTGAIAEARKVWRQYQKSISLEDILS